MRDVSCDASLRIAASVLLTLVVFAAGCSGMSSSGSSGGTEANRASAQPKSVPPANAPARAKSAPAKVAPTAKTPTASASAGYAVTFGVTSRAGRLGAVQFEANAKGSADWQGAGASVACRNASGASMLACNDKGGGLLSCAFVDAKGIGTPVSLVTCGVSSSKPLAASDFSVKLVDASSPDMKPAKPSVGVTAVSAK